MARGFAFGKNLTKETILQIAAAGAIILIAAAAPNFMQLIQPHFNDKNKKATRARARKLRELKKKRLVSFTELGGGNVKIELTQQGEKLVRIYDLEKMKLKKPPRWDHRWRIIIYDIPSSKRKASDAFRKKIRQMGLFQLQRSVWISPYDCLPEIEFLASIFEIDLNDHIHHFMAPKIPREEEAKEFFDLK